MPVKPIGTDYWLKDGSKYTVSEEGTYVPDDAIFSRPTISLTSLPKLLVIDRLDDTGLFKTALDALKSNPTMYERWSASNAVNPADPDVNALLDAIGADKSLILAPE